MVLAKKALVGLAVVAAGAAVALSNAGDAQASTGKKPKDDGDKKPDRDKTTPNGKSKGHISDQTFDALLKQDIAKIRSLVTDWQTAGDPLTAGALSFTLEAAVKGEQLPEWPGDGSKGSPLLRAFGERVLVLEGRPKLLNMWAEDYKPAMPVLASALAAKADGIEKPSPEKGSTDDPVPDAALLQRIIAVMASGDPIAMRKLADELDKAGFDTQAADLRKAADMIEKGSAKVPEPEKPAPTPVLPGLPTPPAPIPAPTPPINLPAGGPGRIVIVKKGEGPFQITQRLLGKAQGPRFPELVSANVPPKKRDAKTRGFTSLNAGERLKVPASWPAHKDAISEDPLSPAAPPPPAPAQAQTRFVIVKKGEGPFQIAQRLLGASQGGARWRELVTVNVPPKKKDPKTGGFTTLNAGERLKVPDTWPSSPHIVFGADIVAAQANPRQVEAGKVALMIYLRKIPPKVLADWQRSEGVEPDGKYGPATAYCLCFRFGIVPPCPVVWGKNEKENRRKFASQMMAAARRDPPRSDEFLHVARLALNGKAA